MSIKKQYLKTKHAVKVSFKLTKKEAKKAGKVFLLSEHNAWGEYFEFKQLKNGDFTLAVIISTETFDKFEFIILLEGREGSSTFMVPDGVDEVIDNGMTCGGKNGVILLKK